MTSVLYFLLGVYTTCVILALVLMGHSGLSIIKSNPEKKMFNVLAILIWILLSMFGPIMLLLFYFIYREQKKLRP